MSENFIRILIYTHATFGGIALLSGLVALVVTKGNTVHRIAGKIFYYSMLLAALLAIVIAITPSHQNYFLLVIGVFSSYMILSGKRILHLKKLFRGEKPASKEFLLPAIMLGATIAMLGYGISLYMNGDKNGIVLLVFGAIGGSMALGDIRLLRTQPTDKKFWLYQHISKMTGGYIASVTAFIVVNEFLPGLWGWLTPTVVGTLYIIYHQRLFKAKGEKILSDRKIE